MQSAKLFCSRMANFRRTTQAKAHRFTDNNCYLLKNQGNPLWRGKAKSCSSRYWRPSKDPGSGSYAGSAGDVTGMDCYPCGYDKKHHKCVTKRAFPW